MRWWLLCGFYLMAFQGFTQDTDSLAYWYPNARFDSVAANNRFVHPAGLTMKFPVSWDKSYLQTEADLKLWARKVDPKYPNVYRDQLDLSLAFIDDSTATVEGLHAAHLLAWQADWNMLGIESQVVYTNWVQLNNRRVAVSWLTIPRLSRNVMIWQFLEGNKWVTVEFSAADINMVHTVETAWKCVASIDFLSK